MSQAREGATERALLDKSINYIVSGLERSGTSLMMQMLHSGGLPIGYDQSRPADEHNPKGYYELAGGKIISRLMDGTFDLVGYGGRIIKITAYGLKFLPERRYKVVYMQRNMDEVVRSMSKMGAPAEDVEKERRLLRKLDDVTLRLMKLRDDIEFIKVSHHELLTNPTTEMERVARFLGRDFDFDEAAAQVDPSLYRSRSGN